MVVKLETGVLATAQMRDPHGQFFVRGVESRGPCSMPSSYTPSSEIRIWGTRL